MNEKAKELEREYQKWLRKVGGIDCPYNVIMFLMRTGRLKEE